MENIDTIINDILYETEKRIEWFLKTPAVHCIPIELFSKMSSERICELYCTELDYFKRSLSRIGSECTHYKTDQKGIIINLTEYQYAIIWYNDNNNISGGLYNKRDIII